MLTRVISGVRNLSLHLFYYHVQWPTVLKLLVFCIVLNMSVLDELLAAISKGDEEVSDDDILDGLSLNKDDEMLWKEMISYAIGQLQQVRELDDVAY